MDLVYNSLFVSQLSKALIIKKITAFFYGNGITLSLVIKVYQICNDKYTSPVANTMSNLHLKWQRNTFKQHTFHYYDVQNRQFLLINGSSMNQTKTVKQEVTVWTSKSMDVILNALPR